AIMLADSNGLELLKTRLPQGGRVPEPVPQLAELRAAAGPDATVISNMYVAPVGGQLGFLIQMPVKRDGQTVYFLSMNVFASQLQSVFSEQQLPESWNGSIIDRNGVIAARNRNADQFVGKPVRDTIMRKMQESREGFNDEG